VRLKDFNCRRYQPGRILPIALTTAFLTKTSFWEKYLPTRLQIFLTPSSVPRSEVETTPWYPIYVITILNQAYAVMLSILFRTLLTLTANHGPRTVSLFQSRGSFRVRRTFRSRLRGCHIVFTSVGCRSVNSPAC
jgi:hypothetical protein